MKMTENQRNSNRSAFEYFPSHSRGFLIGSAIKNPPSMTGSISGSGRSPGGGLTWQSAPAFVPGESHGQRSLAGYSPRGRTELDTTEATEQALMHFLSPLKKVYYSPEFPIKYLGLKRFTFGKLRNPDLFCDLIEVTWWQKSEFQ